ncbi:unnamed protein product [Prorocentrum cordatum]|uniref:Uncharacterized protein n=1 Tax=Prorocentrum cordatum TaxID=2364126 RepID=A0ABN9QQ16_9DINO|nr:unnamed protein product [Polarella glacialis]
MPRATGPRPAELHPGAPGRARRGRADHHNMKTTAVVARHPLLYRGATVRGEGLAQGGWGRGRRPRAVRAKALQQSGQ